VRDLDIADNAMLDPWMRRLTYAVTEADTKDSSADGGITIVDGNGNSVTSKPGIARYVVFSHGLDGSGAYTNAGALYAACPPDTKESGNCDNKDATFIATDWNQNNKDTTQDYDDYLVFNVTPPPSTNGCPFTNVTLGDTLNYKMFDDLKARGCDMTKPLNVTITLKSGAIIGSAWYGNPGIPAFDTQTGANVTESIAWPVSYLVGPSSGQLREPRKERGQTE
jgi:hypothetical protein